MNYFQHTEKKIENKTASHLLIIVQRADTCEVLKAGLAHNTSSSVCILVSTGTTMIKFKKKFLSTVMLLETFEQAELRCGFVSSQLMFLGTLHNLSFSFLICYTWDHISTHLIKMLCRINELVPIKCSGMFLIENCFFGFPGSSAVFRSSVVIAVAQVTAVVKV